MRSSALWFMTDVKTQSKRGVAMNKEKLGSTFARMHRNSQYRVCLWVLGFFTMLERVRKIKIAQNAFQQNFRGGNVLKKKPGKDESGLLFLYSLC